MPVDSVMVAIDVRLDLATACTVAGLDADQREYIAARFNDPDASDREVGVMLGWPQRRIQRVARSLREDRRAGYWLRVWLAEYL